MTSAFIAAALPGLLVFGMAFGALAQDAGLDASQGVAMSLLSFSGAAQIAAVGALSVGSPWYAAALTGLLVASRYLPLGLYVGRGLQGPRSKRLLLAAIMTDQGVALASARGPALSLHVYVQASLALWFVWVVGTALGFLLGDQVHLRGSVLLVALAPVVFIMLLAMRMRTDPLALKPGVAGAVIAAVVFPLLGTAWAIALSALGALTCVKASGHACSGPGG